MRRGAAVQPWADFLVYAALAALPWCGRDLAAAGSVTVGGAAAADVDESAGGGDVEVVGGGGGGGGTEYSLASLLAAVEGYMGSRPVAADEALRPMMSARSEEDLAAKSDSGGASFLTELWEAVCECRDNAWEVQVLTNPHGPYLEKLASAQPLEGLPPLEVPHWPPGVEPSLPPAVAAARVRRLYPARGGLRLLSREYLEGDLPGVERVVVQEYVLDTLAALSSDRTACVLTLSGALPHHLASVFGPQRATVRNFVAEALFGQMLRLPAPALSHAAYCTLLVDLCKVPHFQFARALSSCVRELFGCMPHLDPELRGRVASWLSYHLSSFSYQWPWDRWQWVAERPPYDPQRGFCAVLLARLLRLADYPVVFKSLPPYFQELLGPPPAQTAPPLPGNLAHHQPHDRGGGGGGAGGQGQERGQERGRGRGRGAEPENPDLLEEAEDRNQPQPMQEDERPPAAAEEGGEGGEEEAPPAVPWAGDPVAETAAALVAWCRQQGSSVASATKSRSLRPEQVSALWSSKAMDWMHDNARQLAEEHGPLAAPKVMAALLLALGVKSPSHLHVAVERYAEAVRAVVGEADADAGALGALPPGSWRAAAAGMGASPGQVAMLETVRHYHAGEPQRLLLVVDRLLALHLLDGPALVAALFMDGPAPARKAARKEGEEGAEGEEAEGQREAGEEANFCALSCFQEPVLSSGSWEVLLHAVDRLVAMPAELPAEVADWERKLAQLQAIHQGVVQSVAAGSTGLLQRERDVAAQVEQASRCLDMVRARLERSSPMAHDALLLMYMGFARLLNRAATEADDALDDESAARADSASALLAAWLRAALRRYAEPSAALVGSGRLREEMAAHEGALGGPPPEAFVAAVRGQLGVRL